MLSTLSSILLSDSIPENPNSYLSHEYGCTPWDPYFDLVQTPIPLSLPKPVGSNSGSEEPVEPNRSDQKPAYSNSGSDDPNQEGFSVIDERKRRRRLSNRESAQRSRMRKQKHFENLRNQVNRLRIENQDLSNQLRFVLYHYQTVRTENNRLRSEHSMLWQKLANIRQIMTTKQLQKNQFAFSDAWPCNNVITTTKQSLIIS